MANGPRKKQTDWSKVIVQWIVLAIFVFVAGLRFHWWDIPTETREQRIERESKFWNSLPKTKEPQGQMVPPSENAAHNVDTD